MRVFGLVALWLVTVCLVAVAFAVQALASLWPVLLAAAGVVAVAVLARRHLPIPVGTLPATRRGGDNGTAGGQTMAVPLGRDHGRPFTFADLDAAPDDGRRWELIGGSLVVSPAPFGAHQWCAGRLYLLLDHAATAGTVVVPAPYDWRVAVTTESFQPDVTVIRRGDFDPAGPLRATPLLVVEIVSPCQEARDRMFKRARYEALGVPGYWIVDPAGPSLTELRLSDGGAYVERTTIAGDDLFSTDHPFPVSLVPAALTWRG